MFGVTSVIYLGLVALAPANPDILAQQDITATQYRLLLMLVALPLIAIWLAAFYAYARISEYTKPINKTKDGRALSFISIGIGVLALGMAVSSLSARLLNFIATENEALLPASTIARTYVTLGFYLAGFSLIYKGVQRLGRVIRKSKITTREWLMWIVFILAGVLFIYLSLESPTGETIGSASNNAVYNLPVWLVVSTVIIPYLLTWAIGLRAAYLMNVYRKSVKGKIYRSFFGYLSVGLTVIVISSILIQYFTALSLSLMKLPLPSILAVVYFLLIILGVGYLLIARGANRLKSIEEA